MAMQEYIQEYYEDLPLLARGKLPPERAAEILRAAQADPALRAAIESERALEEILDLYQPPEPSVTLQGRFWKRFHEGEAVSRTGWWLKLAGPLAAGVLVTIGIIMFFRGDDAPVDTTPQAAEEDADDDAEIDWTDIESYAAGPQTAPEGRKLSAEDLALLRTLNDKAFLALDNVEQPEDLTLMDDLELLRALDRAEGK